MKPYLKILTLLILLAGLSGCALLGPDYERPTLALPDSYGDAETLLPSDMAKLNETPNEWWTLYQDPQLNALVEKAFKNITLRNTNGSLLF